MSLDTGDYEKGLDQASKKSSGFASTLKKGLATAAKVGAAAIGAAATGIAALTKASIDQYAEYEQLVGGVDTLFGTAASKVKEYAEQAFQSAGMSANEYMTTVTSFSASLLQSLGGDTEKAAQKADQAIRDMSDNANKMGTSMEMIQNAYQGFAKQNYTMLDNLKLGYGGTQKEMQRLLKDAEKLSGIKYDISSYADIVDAIHVVQTEMGITGTTAKEASSTISGSVGMMKAAWKNFMTGLADETADHGQLMENLVSSVETVGQNIIPVIQRLIPAIADGIGEMAMAISQQIPEILTTAMSSIPALVDAANVVIKNLVSAFDLKQLVEAGAEIVTHLVMGFTGASPGLTGAADEAMSNLLDAFWKIADGAKKVGAELLSHLEPVIEKISDAFNEWFTSIDWEAFQEKIDSFVNTMVENGPMIISVIAGIATGFAAWNVVTLIQGVVSAIKSFKQANDLAAISQKLLNLVMNANPVGILITAISALVGFILTLWATNEDFRYAMTVLWDEIKAAVVGAWESIKVAWDETKDYFQGIWDKIVEIFTPVAKTLGAFFKNAWNAIVDTWNLAVGFFQNIWDTIAGIFEVVEAVLSGDFEGAWNAIKNVFNGWREFFSGLWDDLTSAFSGVLGWFTDVGKNIVGGIKNGIASAWDGLKSWFNGIWNSLFGGRSVNVNVNKTQSGGRINGSHAGGLRSVPFDGYIAELHKGERVLTRKEACRYRDGEGRMGTVNITVNAAPGQSETVIAQKVARILENERERRAAAFG